MAHHYQPDLTERAHFSLPLSLSHTHKQFSNFCLFLSFSEGRIFRLQKLRLKYWKKIQAEKKNYHPLVRAFMMQVSRESYPSEWKIYDCLPLFQNITLTLSRSKRSSPSCLFSMKSLRFLKTWNRKHMLACLSYAQNRGGKEREGEALSIIFDILQKSCFPPLRLNKPAKICMELINGSRCGAFKSVSFE